MKKIIISIVVLALFGCAQTQEYLRSPAGQALLTNSESVASIAVNAAATYYGGPIAGQLAAAALDALATVLQGYINKKVPASVVKAAPGIQPVATAVAPLVSTKKVVTQADVNALFKAASIASAKK